MTDPRTKRVMVLVEMDMPCDDTGRVILSDLHHDLIDTNPGSTPMVWGIVEGVDATFRKVRQLAKETDEDAPRYDRVHSAQKAVSFFRDMFPRRFWDDKQIGGPRGLIDERTGRQVVR